MYHEGGRVEVSEALLVSCWAANTLTWFQLFSPAGFRHNLGEHVNGGDEQNSQHSVTMQSQLPARAEECSLCGGAAPGSDRMC